MRRLLATVVLLCAVHASPDERVRGLVFNRDLPAGAVVSAEMLDAVAVPPVLTGRAFVTAADAKYVLGQKLAVPVMLGDVVRFSFLAGPAQRDEGARCAKAVGSPTTAVQQLATHRRAVLQKR